jgi:hypothetical protein
MFPLIRLRSHTAKDKRGFDLISDALAFGRLWYGELDAINSGALKGIKRCSAAFAAGDSHFGQRGTGKVLYVPSSGALPKQATFLWADCSIFLRTKSA